MQKEFPNPYEIQVLNSDRNLFGLFRASVLSTLGLPPPKMQEGKHISKIPKNSPKPYEIHVPNSDRICLDFSEEIC